MGPVSTTPGPQGDTGIQEPKGDKGDKGDTGNTGPQRPAGQDTEMPSRAVLSYTGSDFTWIYPTLFSSGIVPIIEAVVLSAGVLSTALYNVQIVGTPTNTSCVFRVNTIPSASVSLTGLLTLTLLQQAPNGVKIHATARTP